MTRYDDDISAKGISMRPEWGEPHRLDPNWYDGDYHGLRMRRRERLGAYGAHRRNHAHDLGFHGGFDGRYDAPRGHFDENGLYHDPFDREQARRAAPGHLPSRDPDAQWRHVENGGVRADGRYLRQYNARSPQLREGHGYDRGFGWAPRGARERPLPPGARRDRELRTRREAGYNSAGFAEEQRTPMDPRR